MDTMQAKPTYRRQQWFEAQEAIPGNGRGYNTNKQDLWLKNACEEQRTQLPFRSLTRTSPEVTQLEDSAARAIGPKTSETSPLTASPSVGRSSLNDPNCSMNLFDSAATQIGD